MTRRRRVFDVGMPEEPAAPAPAGDVPLPRRPGPMATAIGETTGTLRERARIEAEVRAENDALAQELVRLRELGLVIELVPIEAVRTTKLARDRRATADLQLDDLKASIRELGLSNPIRVEPDGTGGYELIQGLRRLEAHRALLADTGEERFAAIPAGIVPPGETEATLYRRMVDENLVRSGVSFAEMAILARSYAADRVDGCEGIDAAVNALYASAAPQKRSYIRRFGQLIDRIGPQIRHPEAISRALGLAVMDRLDADPDAVPGLVGALRGASGRGAEAEVAVLRRFADAGRPPAPGAAPERDSPPRRGAPRRTISLRLEGDVPVLVRAGPGRLEMRAEIDFAELGADALERAAGAFVAALNG